MAANMERNKSLAGQSVKQGGYTVTYNENGYATKAVKDGGASATSAKKTASANDSAAHQEAYQAAQNGDWDAVGVAVNKIAAAGGANADGTYDMSSANQYLRELADEFGYNAEKYYDGSGGGTPTVSGSSTGGSSPSGSSVLPYEGGDASQYLKDLYAQKSSAQLAALKSTYEQNVADSYAQDAEIEKLYEQQKNQTAAQNDLQRMQMNEYGIMRGLNTGASGQMALAQSAALQGSFAQLGSQEAQSLADNALYREKLTIAYRNAIDQAEAEGKYQLANALYNEYVRQDELARQEAAAAQEQANWEAKFQYQQQQDSLANAASMAELLAGFGDFSGYKALG